MLTPRNVGNKEKTVCNSDETRKTTALLAEASRTKIGIRLVKMAGQGKEKGKERERKRGDEKRSRQKDFKVRLQ